ncbi:MAG TPA: hypothetical protein VFC21_06525 [Bryobacteraceae bacterium]|nr:hypothetical protein [Bryobacteraceae bacterium]
MKLFTAAALLFISGIPAFCNPVVLSGTAVFTGVNGDSVNGYYTSPYYVTFDNLPEAAYCDDFTDHMNIGEVWQAAVYSGANLSQTYWGLTDPNYAQDYNAMFWLVDQSQNNGMDQVSAQQALWSIEDSSYAVNSTVSALVSRAMASTMTPSNFVVMDSTDPSIPNRAQEFIMETTIQAMTNATTAPEPRTELLLGSGCLLLLWIGKGRASRV